jgi:cytochrome P450
MKNIGGKVPFAEAITELLEVASDRLVDPLWKLREAITTVGAETRQNGIIMRQHILRMIAKHRAEDWSDPNKKRDLLMMFMEATDSDGQPCSDQYIVDMMLNLTVSKGE